jgi:hypothetical protein
MIHLHVPPRPLTNITYYFSRSPGHRVPWWVLIWIKRSPLVFLVLSVACFSVGLVLFAYSSKQAGISSCYAHPHSTHTSFVLESHRIPHDNHLYRIQLLRFGCCVCLVRVRTLDLRSTQRQEVAPRFTRRLVGCSDVHPALSPVL